MCRSIKHSGMTLMEILVVLTIISILVGVSITAANAVRQRAAVDLTQSMLDVLDTALQQYYTDHNAFPPQVNTEAAFETLLFGNPPNNTISVIGTHEDSYWSAESLYYCLNRSPNSHSIIASLSDSLLTSKDKAGAYLAAKEDLAPGETFDLLRFVDAWGTTLQYEYVTGATFPTVFSAGPDKKFSTGDDITNE